MAERRPLILDETGLQRELPAGDSLPGAGGGSSVPISTTSYTVAANTSVVAVDTLEIVDTLIVDGNLAVI